MLAARIGEQSGAQCMGQVAPQRIAVTGSARFIGSFLCERLLEDRHEVLCIDNFYTGRRRQPDITRAREILGWQPATGLAVGLDRTIAYFRGAL